SKAAASTARTSDRRIRLLLVVSLENDQRKDREAIGCCQKRLQRVAVETPVRDAREAGDDRGGCAPARSGCDQLRDCGGPVGIVGSVALGGSRRDHERDLSLRRLRKACCHLVRPPAHDLLEYLGQLASNRNDARWPGRGERREGTRQPLRRLECDRRVRRPPELGPERLERPLSAREVPEKPVLVYG